MANKVWIHNLHLGLIKNHLVFQDFTMSSLDVSRIYHEFTWCSANLLWINYLYRGLIKKSLDVSLISYEFTIYLTISLSIHNRIAYSFSRIHHLFAIFILDSSRINLVFRKFTIYFTISLQIQSIFGDFTINFVSISPGHFQFTIESRIYYE